MGLEKDGKNNLVFKDEAFGVASNWLVTIFCIIYIILGFVLGEKGYIVGLLYGFNIIYPIIILIVYWVLRKKQTDNLLEMASSVNLNTKSLTNPKFTGEKNTITNNLKKSIKNFNDSESKLTSFRKLMLVLSNVPGFITIIYFIVLKFLINKKYSY
jgi:hypothetical protein